MKLAFLGTRGNVEETDEAHEKRSALLVSNGSGRVLVDCGESWVGELDDLNPAAIVVTHAHPGHVLGLKEGAPCPVHATQATWKRIGHYPIEPEQKKVLPIQTPVRIAGLLFEAFPVEHSIDAPTVGYRIADGEASVFYAPDVVWIHERSRALQDTNLYIGDGATLERSLVRRKENGGALVGHTPVRTQLTWCRKEGVGKMIVTHCGREIIESDEARVEARLEELAAEREVDVELATDGMEIIL